MLKTRNDEKETLQDEIELLKGEIESLENELEQLERARERESSAAGESLSEAEKDALVEVRSFPFDLIRYQELMNVYSIGEWWFTRSNRCFELVT